MALWHVNMATGLQISSGPIMGNEHSMQSEKNDKPKRKPKTKGVKVVGHTVGVIAMSMGRGKDGRGRPVAC